MIHFYENSKLYVLAPAGVVTGGSELLHQLVDIVNNNGKEAFIVYYGKIGQQVPDDYKKYNIKLADEFEDSKNNIVLLYEGIFNKVRDVKNAQIILWWLSVDLMYYSSIDFLDLRDIYKFSHSLWRRALISRIYQLVKGNGNKFSGNISLRELRDRNYTNAYQSVYAQNFLYNHGFSELVSLSDYINTDFLNSMVEIKKKNIVLYNPKKGIKFTKKIIKKNPDIQFVPIQNLSREGVVELMNSAKVYIDFGFHPGKDRLPREAALLGCIVITDKSGSAYFYEDVAIPSDYKFNAKRINISQIGLKIRNSIENYDEEKKDMQCYCRKIKREKETFEREVLELLEY